MHQVNLLCHVGAAPLFYCEPLALHDQPAPQSQQPPAYQNAGLHVGG